jgi:23S rRNA (pseudouridine1915-N3)-methyltransferase
MKIHLLLTGKTTEKYLQEGISVYERRLKHYIPFTISILPEVRNTGNTLLQKQKEADLYMRHINPQDYLVVLDEKGKELSSVEFSAFLEKSVNGSVQRMVFVVGGPYGVDESLLKRANLLLSLSRMTFSHQMVRLFFAEQLYRAFTIIRKEPYHHE